MIAVSVAALLSVLGGTLWHNAQLSAALYDSLVSDARATRRAREDSYRVKVFNLLTQALTLKNSKKHRWELRQEAAACLGDFVGLKPITSEELPARIVSAALHPDGALLAVGLADGTIHLRRVPDGVLVRRLPGHTSPVVNLAFRTGGKELVSVDWTGKFKVWHANRNGTWACSRTFVVERTFALLTPSLAFPFFTTVYTPWVSPLASAALTHDGRYLAASWTNATVALVDIADGTTARQFPVPNAEQISTLAVSPDGKLLAGGYEDRERFGVLVWDIRTGALKKLLPELEGVRCISFSPDSSFMACTHDEGVALYDTVTFERRPFERGDLPRGVAFSPDSQILAYQAQNYQSIRLWNIPRNRYTATLRCKGAFWVEFSRDGKFLVAVTAQRVHTWDLAGADEKLVLDGHAAAVSSLVFSPDGKLVATSGRDHKLKIWNPATGLLIKELEFSTAVEGLSFSPDGRVLAAGNYDNGTVRFYDAQSWEPLTVVQPLPASGATVVGLIASPLGHGPFLTAPALTPAGTMHPFVGGKVLSTAFSADGQYFAVGGSDGLTLWRVGERRNGPTISFRLVRPLRAEFSASICFSRDGKWLAWVGGPWGQDVHEVHVWDLRRSQFHALSMARSRTVMKALGFSDDQHVAFVNDKSALVVWDVATEREVSPFNDGQLRLTGTLHISADGAWCGAETTQQSVAVWDMAARTPLVVLPAERACSVGWSPDRQLLAVGGSDGGLEIWNLSKSNARLAAIGLGW